MFSPVRIFRWMDFDSIGQVVILPNEVHVVIELAGSITYNKKRY